MVVFLAVGFVLGLITGIFVTSLCVVASDADKKGDKEE